MIIHQILIVVLLERLFFKLKILTNHEILVKITPSVSLSNGSTNTLTRCRITVNDHETPKEHRLLAMQYVSRQISVLSPETLLNHRVHVTHCNDASVYLLSSMKCISVKQCSRTTLVTGPVSGTLYLTGCISMRIICIARRIVLRYPVSRVR